MVGEVVGGLMWREVCPAPEDGGWVLWNLPGRRSCASRRSRVGRTLPARRTGIERRTAATVMEADTRGGTDRGAASASIGIGARAAVTETVTVADPRHATAAVLHLEIATAVIGESSSNSLAMTHRVCAAVYRDVYDNDECCV